MPIKPILFELMKKKREPFSNTNEATGRQGKKLVYEIDRFKIAYERKPVQHSNNFLSEKSVIKFEIFMVIIIIRQKKDNRKKSDGNIIK